VRSEFLFGVADILGTVGVTEYVTLEAGPWLSFRVSEQFRHSETLLAPSGAVFPDTRRTERDAIDGAVIAGPRLAGGAMLALRFASPLPGDVDLIWDMHTRLDARALVDKLSIRSFSIGAGLALMFRREIPIEAEPAFESALPPVIATPQPKKLEATISLSSTTASGERVHYALVRTSQHYFRRKTPMIPALFFDRNSALIPFRYVQFAPGSPASFSTKSMIRLDAIGQHSQLLNVLGMRLAAHSEATLTITGCASAEEPASIALARAEAVQTYLRTVWDVKASRLKLESRPPHGSKAPGDAHALRSVEFSSNARDLLEAVATDWMVERFHSAPINLDPSIRNTGALKDWTITISHKGREVARYSNNDGSAAGDLDANVLLRGTGSNATDVPPLIAHISAADSSGTITTATDALQFLFSGDTLERGRDVTVLSSTTELLSNADFTLSPEGARNREIVRELASLLSDGDSVTVAPLIESRPGGPGAPQLSRSAVQHVASTLLLELGKKNVAIILGRGREHPPPNETTPEIERLLPYIAITLHRNLGTAKAGR
jgi:hypothetical protein